MGSWKMGLLEQLAKEAEERGEPRGITYCAACGGRVQVIAAEQNRGMCSSCNQWNQMLSQFNANALGVNVK